MFYAEKFMSSAVKGSGMAFGGPVDMGVHDLGV